MSYIEFRDVKKTYHVGEVDIHALAGASFQVEKGEFIVVAGASGAGKSTILNILGGMDTCTSGEILVDGKRIDSLNERQLTDYRRFDIGFVFQFYNLVQNLTALENVELATEICKNPLDSDEILDKVGLQDRKNNFPSQLSGGEQQRVAIARAIVNRPSVLIADEPTGNLDPNTSKDIVDLFKHINNFGTTVIMVTHNMDIVTYLNKRVIELKDGRVLSDNMRGAEFNEA